MQSWQAPEMHPEHRSLPMLAVLHEILNRNRSPFAMHPCLSGYRDYR